MGEEKNNNKEELYYNLSWEKVVQKMDSNQDKGLSEEEAEKRRKKYGKNKLPEGKQTSKLELFLKQFKSPLIYILVIVGVVIFAVEDPPDSFFESGFVFVAVIINALFGFWEENKASETFQKLKNILKTKAVVLRSGNKKEVFKEEVVPGDIIVLNAGEKIPADGRLVKVDELKLSEAVLTGEWEPASKKTDTLDTDTTLANRDNMVYGGCLVKQGEGKAVVTSTGADTEVGKITTLIQETKEEMTPLQKKLDRFGKIVGVLLLALCALIFGAGIITGKPPLEMFETAVAIAVGGIPEALPVIMTLVLVIGMESLAKKKGLVRKLSSIETLGSTSVICCDKTKTLTEGKMRASKVISYEKEAEVESTIKNSVLKKILKISTLCNQAFIENPEESPENWNLGGSSTDKALLLAGAEVGFLKPDLSKEFPAQEEMSFDDSKKYQATLHKNKEGSFVLYVSGAPEKVLKISKGIEVKEGEEELDSKKVEKMENKLEKLTQRGLRVIGVGYKELNISESEAENIEELGEYCKDIVFGGLVALKDPIRSGVKEAINTCKQAGLNPVVITGDYKDTAKDIAEDIGIKAEDKNIVLGKEVEKFSDKELVKKVKNIKIYARAEPKHKIKIVEAWQKKGKIVAMTGDGVNDAPALKKADIGLALGSGTEVAKEASDLILLNNGFNIIENAIEEGRSILDNLRKAITYVLFDSFASVILIGISVVLGWPLPVLWTQILWNNFVEDTLPDVAYAFEPKEKDVMKRGPNPPDVPLLNKEMKILIFGTGFLKQAVSLLLFWILWQKIGLDLDYARTMVFGTLCIDTAFITYSFKNLTKNIWEIPLFNNRFLMLTSLLVFLVFSAAVYIPFLQTLLDTTPLGINSWLILIGIALFDMFLIEITKFFFTARREKK